MFNRKFVVNKNALAVFLITSADKEAWTADRFNEILSRVIANNFSNGVNPWKGESEAFEAVIAEDLRRDFRQNNKIYEQGFREYIRGISKKIAADSRVFQVAWGDVSSLMEGDVADLYGKMVGGAMFDVCKGIYAAAPNEQAVPAVKAKGLNTMWDAQRDFGRATYNSMDWFIGKVQNSAVKKNTLFRRGK